MAYFLNCPDSGVLGRELVCMAALLVNEIVQYIDPASDSYSPHYGLYNAREKPLMILGLVPCPGFESGLPALWGVCNMCRQCHYTMRVELWQSV